MNFKIDFITKNALYSLYFFVSLIEVIAEFFNNITAIMISKPLILPILAAIYIKKSKKMNKVFVIALFFSWMANIFYINTGFKYIAAGSFLFLIYRILIIYIVFKKIKLPSRLPMLVGCLPFLFLYLYSVSLIYDQLGNSIYLFIFQGVFLIILGGFSLGSFIMSSNNRNTLLLISTMLFTFTQFLLLLKSFYADIYIFQPLAMIMFVFAQFLLYKFMISTEKDRRKMKVKAEKFRYLKS